MVVKAEIVCQQSVPVLDVQFFGKGSGIEEVEISSPVSSPSCGKVRVSESAAVELSTSELAIETPEKISDPLLRTSASQYFPSIQSGSFADIGPRRFMEDEHIQIDDLQAHLGSLFKFPLPSAFYGVFDGHGGPEAAAYVKKNAMRLFFEDGNFPQTCEVDDMFLEGVESSMRRAFLSADLALADDCSVSSSAGTTAITAMVLGRCLVVANVGDCRAVLCRKGEAIDMSQDHRPIYPAEQRRVQELGGFIDDGYLNGVLSVSRALGDWDMKSPKGSASPLIAEPEFQQIVLTDDDEFLILGCDGIWDVMSSQHAVSLVRRGLRRHGDPDQCARDLVMEALHRDTFDNLTVVVVSLSNRQEPSTPRQQRLKCCNISAEALCMLRSLLESGATR